MLTELSFLCETLFPSAFFSYFAYSPRNVSLSHIPSIAFQTMTMALASSPACRSPRDTRQMAHYIELKWNSDNIEVMKNVAYTTRHDMSSWYLIAWVFLRIHLHRIPSKWLRQGRELADTHNSINMDNSFPTVVTRIYVHKIDNDDDELCVCVVLFYVNLDLLMTEGFSKEKVRTISGSGEEKTIKLKWMAESKFPSNVLTHFPISFHKGFSVFKICWLGIPG